MYLFVNSKHFEYLEHVVRRSGICSSSEHPESAVRRTHGLCGALQGLVCALRCGAAARRCFKSGVSGVGTITCPGLLTTRSCTCTQNTQLYNK